jgi:hypothetical protein
MDSKDVKKPILNEAGENEQSEVVEVDAKPVGSLRPSDYLVGFHLHQSAPLANLGVETREKVSAGTVDLYNRLKVHDAVDSIYCLSIVALLNASMHAYDEATWSSKNRDESLERGYEGTALLMDLVTARENRRALLEDRSRREEVLEQLMQRYGLAAPVSAQEK